jgi:hypothetical protein
MSGSTEDFSGSERLFKRYATNYSELFITYEGYSEEVSLRPPDLSIQGMFVQTVRHFNEGAVLKVRFRLARSQKEINTRAEVRYCLPGVGIGIEFLDISDESRKAIEEELAGSELPPSPNR